MKKVMMAYLKLIAAVLLPLCAIVLEIEAAESLATIANQLWTDMDKRLSKEDQADTTKAFSFAKEYISKLEKSDAKTGRQLLTAWKQILRHPNECNRSSLRYLAKIGSCEPLYSESKRSLTEVTKVYASKCLTQNYIAKKIKSQLSACFLRGRSEAKVDFIDEQFIADYWSEHREDWPLTDITSLKATKAVAKAINRERNNDIEDLKSEHQVHAYLNERFYKPCFEYMDRLSDLMMQIYHASRLLEGGQDQLVSSLDKSLQHVFFRFKLCADNSFYVMASQSIEGQVVSALKSLPTSQP